MKIIECVCAVALVLILGFFTLSIGVHIGKEKARKETCK